MFLLISQFFIFLIFKVCEIVTTELICTSSFLRTKLICTRFKKVVRLLTSRRDLFSLRHFTKVINYPRRAQCISQIIFSFFTFHFQHISIFRFTNQVFNTQLYFNIFYLRFSHFSVLVHISNNNFISE